MFKILIVDDTKGVHAYLKGLFSKFPDMALTDVFNGQEALDCLKGGAVFDLVLLDWEMPVLNGPSTLMEIRKMQLPFPTMMMTTKNSPDEIVSMLELGAADYLMKPFTLDILLGKIEMVCGKALADAA
jgi:two-component system, chemotaxis family, chemotaxis protein CheY